MSHAIYQTEGIIIGHYPAGEADKTLCIITERFGYIYAKAKSVRSISSKLRGNLQDLTHTHLDLVRGKYSWRVVGAKNIDSKLSNLDKNTILFSKIMRLVKKLYGEVYNQELFNEIKALYYLEDDLTSKEVELIGVIRILAHLGYWDKENMVELLEDKVDGEKVKFVNDNYRKLLIEVNEAIGEALV